MTTTKMILTGFALILLTAAGVHLGAAAVGGRLAVQSGSELGTPATLKTLVDRSRLIVDATVELVYAPENFGPKGKRVETDAQMRIARVLKGVETAPRLVVSQWPKATMRQGERYILFLVLEDSPRMKELPVRSNVPRYAVFGGQVLADGDKLRLNGTSENLKQIYEGKNPSQFLVEVGVQVSLPCTDPWPGRRGVARGAAPGAPPGGPATVTGC